MKIVLLFLMLQGLADCTMLYFGRGYTCIQNNEKGCLKWNDTVTLSIYHPFSAYMCFPGKTKVITKDGSKTMDQLSIGDSILGYNYETNRAEYSEMMAWLHRDHIGFYEFNRIHTSSNQTY